MTILVKTRAIRRKIESVGFLNTLLLIFTHLKNLIFYRTYLIYSFELKCGQNDANIQHETLSVRSIRSLEGLFHSDIKSIEKYGGKQYIEAIRVRLEKKWVLFLGYYKGEVAGAAWLIPDISEFKTKNFRVEGSYKSIIDCWTLPEFRGNGIYPSILSFILNELKDSEAENVLIEVNEKNTASIRGIEKVGFNLLPRSAF